MSNLREYGYSYAAGIVAGVVYFVLHTSTPAPPWPALVGLCGILLGESTGRRLNKQFRSIRSTRASRSRTFHEI
ncbi:DUF1427 family protein [Pseudarthrobacter sp. LMD1-1-1.1]|uniref:DUF1427 family protein n=1 Tax=Pseudarthrobacter sp. LMD1-1-1.1 TaxID=3135242 RepID=UPI003430DE04